MKKLILTILIMSGVQAYAGNDGGGGGVICITSEKCITLAEAGLRIKADGASPAAPQRPALSLEVVKEVEAIINALPLHFEVRSALEKITNVPVTAYRAVEYIDDKNFKKIKEEYYKILSENNFPSSDLEIAAVSDFETTYLLPEFYKLSLRSQALTTIHEAVVRKTGSVLKALELDGYIVDALNGKQNSYELTRSIVGIGYDNLSSTVKYVVASYIRDQQTNFGKKYKLSPNLMSELSNGVDLKEDLYISNELYDQYPDLWKVLLTSGVNDLRVSRYDRPVTPNYIKQFSSFKQYSDDEVLRMNGFIGRRDMEYCKNIEDGTYISGSIHPPGMVGLAYLVRVGDITLITCSANKIESVIGLRINERF